MARLLVVVALLVLAVGLAPALAADGTMPGELAPGLVIPDAARPGPDFDVERATRAYIELLSPEQRARSDAYFEGGYWLKLWDLLYGFAIAAILLLTGASRRMRERAERITRRPALAVMLYALQWLVAFTLLALPLSLYEGYFREHQYGLSTQTMGAWFGDALKGLLVSLVLVPPVLAALYAAVRRTRERWWVWAGVGSFALMLFLMLLAPVLVEPLFNDYKPLREGPARTAILSLARANQVPTDNVVEFDASRQTTRISANVSGFLGTTRIALNDNLLERTSEPEIKAVMGHEMGHYVLNHVLRLVVYFTLVLTLGFWFVHKLLDAALARWGARLGLRDRADPAALPLAVAILSLFFFLATPVMNTITRQAEFEADIFGLDAAREPHGFATVAMRLSAYRKIEPGPIEEFVFYDHPSGYTRVRSAMLWLAENQDNPTANAALPARR